VSTYRKFQFQCCELVHARSFELGHSGRHTWLLSCVWSTVSPTTPSMVA
jgi:hypothetical protein